MNNAGLEHIVVIGATVEGWISAVKLANELGPSGVKVSIIENSLNAREPSTITFARIDNTFHQQLALDLEKLTDLDQAQILMGNEYQAWQDVNSRFIFPFSQWGKPYGFIDFCHFLTKAKLQGRRVDVDAYSPAAALIKANKLALGSHSPIPPLSQLQFGAVIKTEFYKKLLESAAIKKKVSVIRSDIETNNSEEKLGSFSGEIKSIQLSNGTKVSACLWVDCSGSESLFIGRKKQNIYHNVSSVDSFPHITEFETSHVNQSRLSIAYKNKGNGVLRQASFKQKTYNLYFSSEKVSPSDVVENESDIKVFNASIHTNRFRKVAWQNNVVAIGRSALDLKPMVFDNVEVVLKQIDWLISLLPSSSPRQATQKEYNRLCNAAFHKQFELYQLLECSLSTNGEASTNLTEKLLDSEILKERISLFQSCGRLPKESTAAASPDQWMSLLLNLQVWPKAYHPFLAQINESAFNQFVDGFPKEINQALNLLNK